MKRSDNYADAAYGRSRSAAVTNSGAVKNTSVVGLVERRGTPPHFSRKETGSPRYNFAITHVKKTNAVMAQ